MTASKVRVPHARLIVAAGAILVCAAILWLSRAYTFYFDEWTYITTAPDWSFWSYFEPHNEHPSILAKGVYAILLDAVGLTTYVPYTALLLIAHFANVVLLFELMRRRAGDLVGLFAAAMLLVIGAGWEDILWAFQMAWLASVALGLGALLLLQAPGRTAAATACLTASIAFSAIGAVFALAATVQLALTPSRRRELLWFVPLAVAVAAWYVAFGRFGEHPNPQPTAANLFLDPPYTLWGLSQSVSGLIGLSGGIGVVLLAAAVVAVAWRWWRRRPDAFAISSAVALVGFFALTGLTRAQLGYHQSAASRYSYIAAVLWLIVLGDLARDLPWRGTWRPALVACVFLACFNSGVLLFAFATARTVLMERQVADFYALAAMRSDPCLAPDGAVDLLVMPVEREPAAYYRAVDRYGDPRTGRPLIDRRSYEQGLRNLRKAGC